MTEEISAINVNLPQGTMSRHGDFLAMPKCQAKAKSTGKKCKNVAMKGKRVCYLHGGKSCGANTPEGKMQSKYARLTHGNYSARAKKNRHDLMMLNRYFKLIELL